MMSVRPFGLQHIPILYRLQRGSTVLDLEHALMRARSPLWAALLGHGSLAEGPFCTVVLTEPADDFALEGFAQARLRPGAQEADLVRLAPTLDEPEAERIWRSLLLGLGLHLARLGVQRIFARLSDELEAAQVFLDSGFVLYTREDVFQLRQVPAQGAVGLLEPADEDCRWGIGRLYAAATPKAVRLAEGLANASAAPGFVPGDVSYVWRQGSDILAHVSIAHGSGICWVRMLMHPDHADRAADVIRDVLNRLPHRTQTVYCSARAYQVNLRGPLQDAGFRFVTSQSVLVRQNALPVREAQTAPAVAFEKRAEARTPTAARHDVLT
ncbi:MAG: hypothetical protein H5T65_06240 [Chloroflexi bacterium]|nr:hypothetical protein [Chloroflexota bacterium]